MKVTWSASTWPISCASTACSSSDSNDVASPDETRVTGSFAPIVSRVADRILGHIEMRTRGDVEGVGTAALHGPYRGQLLLTEVDGGAEHQLAELAFVADLAELLDHTVQHGHGVKRRRGRPVCGMGESLGTDVWVTE